MILITDLDNTLGKDDVTIASALQQIVRLKCATEVCIITGRSLRALAPLEHALPTGVYISPWGGGNVLLRTDQGYRFVRPPRLLCPAAISPAFTTVAVPCGGEFSSSDEVHRRTFSHGSSEMAVVGAYCQTASDCGQTKHLQTESPGSFITSARGHKGTTWSLVVRSQCPRLETVQWVKGHLGDTCVAYLGDDAADGECVSAATVFLAPADSVLAAEEGVLSYQEPLAVCHILKRLFSDNEAD